MNIQESLAQKTKMPVFDLCVRVDRIYPAKEIQWDGGSGWVQDFYVSDESGSTQIQRSLESKYDEFGDNEKGRTVTLTCWEHSSHGWIGLKTNVYRGGGGEGRNLKMSKTCKITWADVPKSETTHGVAETVTDPSNLEAGKRAVEAYRKHRELVAKAVGCKEHEANACAFTEWKMMEDHIGQVALVGLFMPKPEIPKAAICNECGWNEDECQCGPEEPGKTIDPAGKPPF